VNRRPEGLQRNLHNVDGAHHAGAESARLEQQHTLRCGRFVKLRNGVEDRGSHSYSIPIAKSGVEVAGRQHAPFTDCGRPRSLAFGDVGWKKLLHPFPRREPRQHHHQAKKNRLPKQPALEYSTVILTAAVGPHSAPAERAGTAAAAVSADGIAAAAPAPAAVDGSSESAEPAGRC